MKKKTNHIIKSLAVAFLGGLSLCSCTDFLTIYPTDKTVGENFWKNKDQVDQMVTGAYTGMISVPTSKDSSCGVTIALTC